MKFNIAFYCKSIPFSDETILLKTSLGGSESALIEMANALFRQGHTVTVFTDIPNETHRGIYDGVRWLDISTMSQMCESVEWDIFISLRFFDIMQQPIRAKYRAIWNQDILSTPAPFFSSLWQVDEIYYVSEWQREQYEGLLPQEVKPLAFVTKNGVNLSRVDEAIKNVQKDMNKLIYISRPERGLAPLLQIFPKLRQRHPELTLSLCRYYSMYELNPNIKRICDEADRAIEGLEGVFWLGNLSKDALYKEIASSALMVYPGVPAFDETSCIAALEAQACGTPMICTNRGGLMETLSGGAGIKISGDAFSEEYQEEFIKACESLLTYSDDYKNCQKAGRRWVEAYYQYADIAWQWGEYWNDFFQARLESNPKAVCRNLIHHDDFRAAAYLAAKFNLTDETNEIHDYLSVFNTPESYASHTIAPEVEIQSGRFDAALAMMQDIGKNAYGFRILDFACGNGSMSVRLKQAFPDAEVIGIDFSETLCQRGRDFARKIGVDIEFRVGTECAIHDGEQFDLIFCGEFLEHCWDYHQLIAEMELHLAPDGWLVWTVPTGPMVEYLLEPKMRAHRIHWETNTVQEVFGEKPGFATAFIWGGVTPRGNITGHFIIRHQKGMMTEAGFRPAQTGNIDWNKKIALIRPYQTLDVCMITKNESRHLRKCLESVQRIADNIWVADLESMDDTCMIAKSLGAEIIHLPPRWPEAPHWVPNPGSFEWARNESIKHSEADWLFWIDADEELIDAHLLRQHLHTRVYEGYIVRQNHLALDAPNRHDKPIRLLRNHRGYRFYGHIHEHCQKSLNDPIFPVYEFPRTEIVHYGYITEGRRQEKCKRRNLQLLALDRQLNPERQLGLALLAREYLNMIHWELQDYGVMTPQATRYAKTIINIYREHFTDSRHHLYQIVFPIYQSALKYLNIGASFKISIESAKDGIRFLTQDEFSSFMAHRTGEAIQSNLPAFSIPVMAEKEKRTPEAGPEKLIGGP